VKPALSIAASMSARSPFVSPFDQREEADQARKKFASDCSDHLTILNAFTKWQELVRIKGNKQMKSFLKEHFLGRLSLLQMQDLSKQFSSILKEIGFLKGVDSENANSTNVGLVKVRSFLAH
jgi:ATP-dependent RNA helicase DHX57